MESPIRVLQVIGIMNRGGAEAMIMNLYRNINRNKIQFDFIEHTSQKAAFDDEIVSLGGKIYHCPKFKGTNIFEYKKWWNNFFENEGKDYHIIHGHIGSTAAIYLSIAKKHGLYTIAHSHNTNNVNDGFNFKQMLYSVLSYNTRNVADYFFACSKQAGIDRFGSKVVSDRSRYSVFNNAIDTDLFKFDKKIRENKRDELHLENRFVIGHVGRFEEQKNHKFILKVFAEWLKYNRDSVLLLVGGGPLEEDIKDYAKKLNIFDSVKFLGVRSDVNELMQAMDVLLFPSIYEGLGVVLIEAQATGLPCLVSQAIQNEAKLIDSLIFEENLNSDIQRWVKNINEIKDMKYNRSIGSVEIAKKYFDVRSTSKRLGDFYESKTK